MASNQDFSEFLRQNKKLIREYIDARLELFKLQGVRLLSRSLGMFIWLTVALFLIFFIILFLGMLFAYWIAEKTGSNVIGFGSTAGLLLIILLMLFLFRKGLFLKPITRIIIRETLKDPELNRENDDDPQEY
jgi:hypothetical protein